MEYIVPKPPINKENLLIYRKHQIDERIDYFVSFTKKEAKIYFNWYIEQIDERIEYLEKYIRSQCHSIELDFSVNSLIAVWDWYEKQVTVEKHTREELEEIAPNYPEWIHESIMSDDTKFSDKTLAICSDVAIYFAEVFRRNHEDYVSWGFFTAPKSHDSVNEPVLLGFIGNQKLNPWTIVFICTCHFIEGNKNFNLYQMYQVWEDNIKRN